MQGSTAGPGLVAECSSGLAQRGLSLLGRPLERGEAELEFDPGSEVGVFNYLGEQEKQLPREPVVLTLP